MTENPTVSIIIPCYNAEKYIGEAIQSALDQTYSRTEVIVIDDGSSDGSLDIIRSFSDSILWKSGPNRGGCAARNQGIELARGELVQFLDADDLLHRDKLSKQVPLVLSKAADIVYCDTEVQRSDTSPWIDSPDIRNDPVVTIVGAQLAVHGPVHWKKLLRSVGGFRNRMPCCQEFDLHLRLACNGATFMHLPEVLVSERKFTGSVSDNSTRIREQQRRVVWNAFQILKKKGEITNERAETFARLLAAGARVLLSKGATQSAIWNLRVAKMMHPSGGLDRLFFSRSGQIMSQVVGPINACRFALFKERFSGRLTA